MSAAQREFDIVLYGATGFVGKLTAEYLARSGGDARIALAGRSPDVARRAGVAGGQGAVLAADRRRRVAAVDAERDGRPDAGGGHHRRALHQVRPAAGRRVRGRGHRLRRPHRRDDVHPREHRPVPQAGRSTPVRASCTHADSTPSLRISPSTRCIAGPAGRRGSTRRHQLRDARVMARRVGRHRRLDDGGHAGGVGRPRGATGDERPLHPDTDRAAEPELGAQSEPRGGVVATSPPNSTAIWIGRLRDGRAELPNRAAQQRIARLGVRPHVLVRREDEHGLVDRRAGGRGAGRRPPTPRRWRSAADTSTSCRAGWSSASPRNPAPVRANAPGRTATTRSRRTPPRRRAPAIARPWRSGATPGTRPRRCCWGSADWRWRSTATGCPTCVGC